MGTVLVVLVYTDLTLACVCTRALGMCCSSVLGSHRRSRYLLDEVVDGLGIKIYE